MELSEIIEGEVICWCRLVCERDIVRSTLDPRLKTDPEAEVDALCRVVVRVSGRFSSEVASAEASDVAESSRVCRVVSRDGRGSLDDDDDDAWRTRLCRGLNIEKMPVRRRETPVSEWAVSLSVGTGEGEANGSERGWSELVFASSCASVSSGFWESIATTSK